MEAAPECSLTQPPPWGCQRTWRRPTRPLLFNSASLMKLGGQPKGHHNNVYATNHFAAGCNLVRTMRRGRSEDVSEPGREAEIRRADSPDSGRELGTIAQKIITPKLFQPHDTALWSIRLYRCHDFLLRLQGYKGDDARVRTDEWIYRCCVFSQCACVCSETRPINSVSPRQPHLWEDKPPDWWQPQRHGSHLRDYGARWSKTWTSGEENTQQLHGEPRRGLSHSPLRGSPRGKQPTGTCCREMVPTCVARCRHKGEHHTLSCMNAEERLVSYYQRFQIT